jgi:hypothetical protein
VCATVETQSGAAATGDARKTHSAMPLSSLLVTTPHCRVLSLSCFTSLFPFLSVTRPPLATTPSLHRWLAPHSITCLLSARAFGSCPVLL